jgi:hypothetical protein
MATDVYSEPRTLETLNVFLHGTFVFLDNQQQDSIRAVIPKIGHHVYRAGTWLGETDLQAGSYQLQGVLPGNNTFDRARNLILASAACQADRELTYATLILPRPDSIASLRLAKIPLDSFDNTAGLALNKEGEQVATLQVFTYRLGDANKLLLGAVPEGKNGQVASDGHYWEPVFSGDTINLHIFSAEDHCERPSHVAEDFQTCMTLLGSKLKLKRAQPAGGISADETLPAGVIAEETEDLAPRTRRMARLGRLLRENGDLNQAWYKNDALDDEPPACGGYICLS